MDRLLDSKQLRLFTLGTILILCVIALGLGASAAAAADGETILQQITPSPTQGQINLPTATATQIGGPTATPSRTPPPTQVLARTIGDPVTNLRSGPGLDFDIVAELPPNTDLPLVGRWLGFQWFLVTWGDAPGGQAWVYEPLVLVIGDITTVPAVTPPPQPTIDPIVEQAQATATVLLQTPGGIETATALAQAVPTGVYTATPASSAGGGPSAPTFTPPADPFVQPDTFEPQNNNQRGGIPPAVVIFSLGAMGLLTLFVGFLRRI